MSPSGAELLRQVKSQIEEVDPSEVKELIDEGKVRPVLWKSLKAAMTGGGGEPPRYTPQTGFLSILSTGDGRALLDYMGIVSHSRWAWRLKDRIDRRFMERYQRLSQEIQRAC